MRQFAGLVLICVSSVAVGAEKLSPRAILDQSGVKGGLVVHLGCGDGRATASLRANGRYVVHGLDADAANVAAARKLFREKGLSRSVSVSLLQTAALPYVDNTVNLLIAQGPTKVPMTEVMRVLCPGGVAQVNGKKTLKPRPDNIDEWTHYLHGPDNNAVARDSVVSPPRRMQWKASPIFGRHHDTLAGVTALVSAAGRIFYVIDEGPTSLMSFPAKWRLVARDAFNGVLLWKRPIPTWASYLRGFRSGPPQLPRRLVASGGSVYVTLGLDAPVSRLDAATGEVLKTYKGTEGADEILLDGGYLLLAAIDPKVLADSISAGRLDIPTNRNPRSLLAVDADSGDVLWRKSGDETANFRPATLAASAGRTVFQCGRQVRCLDVKTGKVLWRHDPAGRPGPKAAAAKKPPRRPARRRGKAGAWGAGYYAPTLVVCSSEKVVLSADLGKLTALDIESGKPLWSCPCKVDFHAPADVFLADGLVWAGLFAAQGRDPRTGKVKRTLDITGLLTAGHHPRCYRNKATDRYVISGKRGLEFFDLDLKSHRHSRNNWARGVCQYGIMPCNGLTYLPPNACCCYAGAMLHGFYAVAGGDNKHPAAPAKRLHRGPAYERIDTRKSRIDNPEAWPTLRGDITRSGSTPTPVSVSPAKAWEAKLAPKLSAPVVGGGRVIVSSVNLGHITALGVQDGKPLWSFAAGGRVDTPPTIHQGLVLFGCADGWVYCLRASDGKLAWRFLAAPRERYAVVDEQIESLWPVHGNILVMDSVAYLAAGRSPYLDGGIFLYGLDVRTGKKVCEARVVIPHDKDRSKAFIMAGVRPDVLVSDGKYIYLQQIKFDKRLVRQKGLGRHLMNHSGLADDTWFYRTFWRLGYGDAYDFPNSYIKYDLRAPFGQLLVFDDQLVCGVQTRVSPRIKPAAARTGSKGCLLFGDPNKPFTPDARTPGDADYPPKVKRPGSRAHKWTVNLPFQARAMVMAGKTLFVAGWPDAIDPKDPFAAIQGRKGGVLWAFTAADGKKLTERKLDSAPVFDGLIAAGGRIYMVTMDGKVICYSPKTGPKE